MFFALARLHSLSSCLVNSLEADDGFQNFLIFMEFLFFTLQNIVWFTLSKSKVLVFIFQAVVKSTCTLQAVV